MKIEPSPELNLVIMAVTVTLGMLVVYFGPDGLVKWVIGLAIILVGVLVEHRIEQAYRAKDKSERAVK